MHPSVASILQGLENITEAASWPVTPPVYQTSNFRFRDVASLGEGLRHEMSESVYTRGHNPTVGLLREKMAALEHTEDALVLSSGCAAISNAVMGQLSAGDHVVCVDQPYGWTRTLFSTLLGRFGVSVSYANGSDSQALIQATREETRLIYLESPNSLTFQVQDLATIAAFAREHGIVTVIDNSYATPVFQNPADLGIDLVVHTASKYLAGHSDVVAGVICGSQERIQALFNREYMTLGAAISPHDAWLFLRGLRTLEIRIERSAASARKVIGFLENQPEISRIHHPFHPSNPQQLLARQQMRGCSGLFSVELASRDRHKIESFCNKLKNFHLAVSWGGFESLVFPLAATWSDQGQNLKSIPGYPIGLVRFYIGLDNPDDLIADLKQALPLLRG